jgi:hypothetical protein
VLITNFERIVMEYEKTGKKRNKDTGKNAAESALRGVDTKAMLWFMFKKHKFGLSVALNIVFAVFFFLPFLPGEIADLLSSL